MLGTSTSKLSSKTLYGIDIEKFDEQKLLDATNKRFGLRFGDFYFYRVEDNLFRIITKR